MGNDVLLEIDEKKIQAILLEMMQKKLGVSPKTILRYLKCIGKKGLAV